jgi:hypothetical protein
MMMKNEVNTLMQDDKTDFVKAPSTFFILYDRHEKKDGNKNLAQAIKHALQDNQLTVVSVEGRAGDLESNILRDNLKKIKEADYILFLISPQTEACLKRFCLSREYSELLEREDLSTSLIIVRNNEKLYLSDIFKKQKTCFYQNDKEKFLDDLFDLIGVKRKKLSTEERKAQEQEAIRFISSLLDGKPTMETEEREKDSAYRFK